MWLYNNKEVTKAIQLPQDAVGFVYCIHNLSNGKDYIGKKNLYCWKVVSEKKYEEAKSQGLQVERHKNKSKSKPGSPVWVYKVRTESDWLKYVGSNKDLQKDIKNGDKIKKVIVNTANCTKQLTYLEVEAQIKMEVLRKNDKFYNQNILGKFWPNDLNC